MKTTTFKNLSLILFIVLCISACSKKGAEAPTIEEEEEIKQPTRNPIMDHVDSSFTVKSKPTAESERIRLNQSFKPTDFVPIGWYAAPNTTFKINVKKTKGSAMPILIIGTYNRERIPLPPYTYVPQVVQLITGDNHINTEQGGLLFIRYEGEENKNESAVKIISGLKPAPFYQGGKTTKEIWRTMLTEFNQSPDAVLFKDKIIIIVEREKAYNNIKENQDQILQSANNIWNYEEEISGLDDTSPWHRKNLHSHLMTEYNGDDYYMAATNYGTIFTSKSAVQSLLKASEMNGWGSWHELGHHHQQQAYLWTGLTEVTVNIYSMYVDKKNGQTISRLESGDVWPIITTYMKKPIGTRNFDADLDVFGKLAMFHQLTMAYGDIFYKTLHKQTREELPNNNSDLLKKRYFMLKACAISGHDLTDFFKEWGMVGVDNVYAEMANLGLSKPQINPSTLRED